MIRFYQAPPVEPYKQVYLYYAHVRPPYLRALGSTRLYGYTRGKRHD